MQGRRPLVLAVILGALIAIPAVVIARGNASAQGVADNFFSASIGEVDTQGDGYTPVGIQLPQTGDPMAVTVSAEMVEGKAKVRLVSEGSSAQPSSALFSSPGANSFTFGDEDSCPPLEVQWKRKGDTRAVASQISVLAVYEAEGCF